MRTYFVILIMALALPIGCQLETAEAPKKTPQEASQKAPARELRAMPAEAKKAFDSLRAAKQFELLSLNPNSVFSGIDEPIVGGFHEWPVLGSVKIDDANTRTQVIAALTDGVRENVKDNAAFCFIPRHGVRIPQADGTTIDWVICFECLRVQVHDGESDDRFTTTESPAAILNKILVDAGVDLPPPLPIPQDVASP